MLEKNILNSFLMLSTLKKQNLHMNMLNHSKMLRIKGVLVEVFAYPIPTIWKRILVILNNPFHSIAPLSYKYSVVCSIPFIFFITYTVHDYCRIIEKYREATSR